MAFCTKCGKQLAEGEVCACSTPVVTPTPQQTEPPKKKKKPLVIIILLAIVIAAVAILVLVLTNKPYMKPVKSFMSAINKQNTDYVELQQTLIPSASAKELAKLYKQLEKSDDYAERFEENEEMYTSNYEVANDFYDNWKLSFEMKKATQLDGDELESIQDHVKDYYRDYLDSGVDYYEDVLDDEDDLEDFADDYDINEKQAKALIESIIAYRQTYKDAEVTDAYEIKGKFVIKADGEKYDTDTVKFVVAKVNGNWAFYSFNEGDMTFDDDYGCFWFISSLFQYRSYYVDIM